MVCTRSMAMFGVSIDLFTNICRNVQKAVFLHQLNKRFALSPEEASEIIAIWGLALKPLCLGVTSAEQDFLTGLLRQQRWWMALTLLFKALHWLDMKNSCFTCLLVSCVLLTQFISFRWSLWTAHAVDIEGSLLSPTTNLLALWNHVFIISIYF